MVLIIVCSDLLENNLLDIFIPVLGFFLNFIITSNMYFVFKIFSHSSKNTAASIFFDHVSSVHS